MARLTEHEAWRRLAQKMLARGVPQDSGCVEWAGYRNPVTGYGQVTVPAPLRRMFGARVATAPVVSCWLDRGPRPDGAVVLHSCDNRACLNPDHLRWGSQRQNSREAWDRGGQEWGERHHQARLSDHQVAEIVARARRGESVHDLAAEYGCDWSTVYRWLRGEGRGAVVAA